MSNDKIMTLGELSVRDSAGKWSNGEIMILGELSVRDGAGKLSGQRMAVKDIFCREPIDVPWRVLLYHIHCILCR